MYQAGHELAQSLRPEDGYKVMTTSWEVCVAFRHGYADEVEGGWKRTLRPIWRNMDYPSLHSPFHLYDSRLDFLMSAVSPLERF